MSDKDELRELKHTKPAPYRWSCVVCQRPLHAVEEDCGCSRQRLGEKHFGYAQLCIHCAVAYDKLVSDPEVLRIHEFLANKEFWRGNGPVIDF